MSFDNEASNRDNDAVLDTQDFRNTKEVVVEEDDFGSYRVVIVTREVVRSGISFQNAVMTKETWERCLQCS